MLSFLDNWISQADFTCFCAFAPITLASNKVVPVSKSENSHRTDALLNQIKDSITVALTHNLVRPKKA